MRTSTLDHNGKPPASCHPEGHYQNLQAELRVKTVGQLLAENMPGVEIHNRHQVQESFLQWHVGDVSGPHLINRRDIPEFHQAGITLGWIAWNRSAGFPIDRP